MVKLTALVLALPVACATNIAAAEDVFTSLQDRPSYELAAMQFLPEMTDSEFGFGSKNLGNGKDYNRNDENCNGFNFTSQNCTNNRSLYNSCPLDGTKYKFCHCNLTKYNINKSNCSYSGDNFSYADFLGSNRCIDPGNAPISTECKCIAKFLYTNNASCGDTKKIIDTTSSCKENDEVRYEKCKCNPAIYTKKYTGGTTYSSGFQSAVESACGHKDNFVSCNENDRSIAYACAIDPSYKYDKAKCEASGSYRVLKGSSQTFTNGNNIRTTLYNDCDCPDTFENNCSGRDKGCYWGWGGTEQTCCNWRKYGDGQHNKGDCIRNYGNRSVINETGEVCYTQKGERKVRCKCEHSGKGYSGNLCGTKVNKKSEIWCYQGSNVISKDCLHESN